MGFADFIGHDDAKLALILNAIEPRCGGVIFIGEKGTGKTTLVRLFRNILPDGAPFVTVPLNVTEDALLGTIDIETTVKTGRKTVQAGLLSRAHSGILFMDDVNLLSPEAVSLILEVNGRKENIIEREGISARHDADFIPVATMDPDEGTISSHLLDRFGMCVVWEGIRGKKERTLIMKKSLTRSFVHYGDASFSDDALREKIMSCRIFLKDVAIPSDVLEHIARTCVESGVSGHRADAFLFYAAKAYAAYCGDKTTTTKHVDVVAPLVMIHRQRSIKEQEEPQHEHEGEDHEENRNEQKNDNNKEQNDNQQSSGTDSGSSSAEGVGENADAPAAPSELKESSMKEEVFAPGENFKTKRLIFRKDRMKRLTSGRRTKTRSKDKGGRYVRSMLRQENDVAIDATIRAAAPYQAIRSNGRNQRDMLVIYESDIRFKQREKKTGHLVVFAVDGSGSMAAQRRMIEAKAAVQSLLMDCYQNRDKVAMIVFRKDRAELVLPPTSSVESASRRLQEIPTGGKTPLSAALIETHALIKRVSKKAPETRFLVVFITDGRANHRLSDLPVAEEIRRAAQLVSEIPTADCIVVDTEDKGKFLTTDLALSLAAYLDADYYTIEDLKADYLVDIVKNRKDAV